MNLSLFGFRNARIVFFTISIMMIIGIISFFTMPANEDPSIKIRQALVVTSNQGLPADKIETLISKPLELAIRHRPEVKSIKSTSSFGQSVITIELHHKYFELDQIWDDVRDEIEQVQLPKDTSKPRLNDSFGDVAVMTMAFTADKGFSNSQKTSLAQDIRDQLYRVVNTEKVSILGIQPERIYIDIKNAKLQQMGLSPQQLAGIISKQNVIKSGGRLEVNGSILTLQPTGSYTSLEDIEQTLIPIPNSNNNNNNNNNNQPILVSLMDIADVRRDVLEPAFQPVYFNGNPAIMFTINMQADSNLLEFTPRMEEMVTHINASLPAGASLNIASKQSKQVEKAVYSVTFNVLQTLLIVLIVVMMFLGVRSGLIVGAIVPAVMLITLAIMNFMGMSIERMSLATLIIALGLLVDSALVFAEDFRQRLESGESRKEALTEGGKSLAIPLLTSSATTILVFLPLMLAVHPAGEYTRSVSIVIMIVLLVSWLLAMLVTPTMCYYFMKVDPINLATDESNSTKQTTNNLENTLDKLDEDEVDDYLANNLPEKEIVSDIQAKHIKVPSKKKGKKGKGKKLNKHSKESFQIFVIFQNFYAKFLRLCLTFRLPYLVIISFILVASIFVFTTVPKKFFPDSDRTQVLIYLTQPAETPMSETQAVLNQSFTQFLDKEKFPHVESFYGYGGFGGPRFVLSLTPINPAENKAFVVLNVDDISNMEETIEQARETFRTSFPNVQAKVMRMFLGPSDANVLQIRLYGPDEQVLYNTAKEVEQLLAQHPNTIDIENNWLNQVTELDINVNQQVARSLGISSDDIAQSLQMYYSGRNVSLYQEGDESIPIVLKGDSFERNDMSRLYGAQIYSSTQKISVPLSQIATIEPVTSFSNILRQDLTRSITIEARNTELSAEAFKPLIDKEIQAIAKNLPTNHFVEYDGAIKQSQEAQMALGKNFPLCFGIIIMLMIAQFNSFRKATMVLLVIPLMMIGATMGLVVMGADFGFMVTLGLYSLAGIIVNNAIILIDRIDIDLQEARKNTDDMLSTLNEVDVLVDASVKRLRPIVMTTVTTILGLLPLMIGQDPLFYGMSAVIAFGLGVGAIITLTFTPVIYSLMYKLSDDK